MKKSLLLLTLLIVFVMPRSYASTPNEKTITPGKILKIPSNESKGFYWPYYLYVPENIDSSQVKSLLIEPNNQPHKNVPYTETLDDAYETIHQRKLLGDILNIPVLVPAFPGTDDINAHTTYYPHALSGTSMKESRSKFKRVDLQLIEMINDARKKMKEIGLKTSEKIIINGFSDSGDFSGRFTLLHPKKVDIMIAGGITGLCLPIKEYNGNKVHFPIGVSDIESYTKKIFDKKAYDNVKKYVYRGSDDKTNPVPGQNYMIDRDRNWVYKNISKDIFEIWDTTSNLLRTNTKNIQVVTYSGIKHDLFSEIESDILNFISLNMNSKFKEINPTIFPKNYDTLRKNLSTGYFLGGREIGNIVANKFSISGQGTSPINAKESEIENVDFVLLGLIGSEPNSQIASRKFKGMFLYNQSNYFSLKKQNDKYYLLIKSSDIETSKKLLDKINTIDLFKMENNQQTSYIFLSN